MLNHSTCTQRRRNANDPGNGLTGLCLTLALLFGLAASTYVNAPEMTGSNQDAPTIHWGGR